MEPLTHDQLEQISRETEHAARKAVRIYLRQARIGFLLLLVGIASAIGLARYDATVSREAIVNSGRAIAVVGCNRDFDSNERLRGLLERARDASTVEWRRGRIPTDRYESAKRFYRDELAKLPQPDCRKALRTVTDDPTRPIVIPAPKYPTEKRR
jgi:hypothetical protein